MVSRRKVLLLGISIGMLTILPSAVAQLKPLIAAWPLWEQLEYREDLIALGRCCAAELITLQSNTLEQLAKALCASINLPANGNLARVGPALQASLQRDYLTGKIHYIDGWCLSHTEILLALIAFRSFGTPAMITEADNALAI